MARDERDKPLWDPEDAHGIAPNPSAYRWSHTWTYLVAIMCGVLGVVALVGAVAPFSTLRTIGALGVLAGVVTIRLSDEASRTSGRSCPGLVPRHGRRRRRGLCALDVHRLSGDTVEE